MASNGKERVLAVLSMSGGNDFLNSMIPYTNPLYYDYRPTLGIPQDDVLPLNDDIGWNPNLPELKSMYDDGKVAAVLGVGYPHPSRSHFRSMDIWHTCEPDKIGDEGWLGRTIRDLDPNVENVLTGVNFGRGLPRAMAAKGVPVASVGDLATLRGPDRYCGPRGAERGTGNLRPHVLSRRWIGSGDRLHKGDWQLRAQGRGHPECGPGQVLLNG